MTDPTDDVRTMADFLHMAMATSANDWSESLGGAVLYGTVCGWDEPAERELAGRFADRPNAPALLEAARWHHETFQRLRGEASK